MSKPASGNPRGLDLQGGAANKSRGWCPFGTRGLRETVSDGETPTRALPYDEITEVGGGGTRGQGMVNHLRGKNILKERLKHTTVRVVTKGVYALRCVFCIFSALLTFLFKQHVFCKFCMHIWRQTYFSHYSKNIQKKWW